MSNESALVMALPIYQLLAKAKKANKLSILQDGIDAELLRRGNDVLSLEISAGVFENFTSMRWHRQNENSLTTGFFGNLFLFGNTNAEQKQLLNAQVSLAQSGDQSISHADAEKILKIPITTVPLNDDSYLNVKRADVLASILLPPGNPFRIYIAAHQKLLLNSNRNGDRTSSSHYLSRVPKASSTSTTSPCELQNTFVRRVSLTYLYLFLIHLSS